MDTPDYDDWPDISGSKDGVGREEEVQIQVRSSFEMSPPSHSAYVSCSRVDAHLAITREIFVSVEIFMVAANPKQFSRRVCNRSTYPGFKGCIDRANPHDHCQIST